MPSSGNFFGMADKVRKGRHTFGAAHPCTKLTQEQVIAILERARGRKSFHWGGAALAREYGVCFQTISDIVRGRRRRRVAAEVAAR